MKGNESDFAFISFHLLAFICVAKQPYIANPTSTMKTEGLRRESSRAHKKAPKLSLRGCDFQRIGRRSEVTGDTETALETAAFAFPGSRNESATAEDRSD